MGSLSVNLCGIELDNPVIPASGTFGYDLPTSLTLPNNTRKHWAMLFSLGRKTIRIPST